MSGGQFKGMDGSGNSYVNRAIYNLKAAMVHLVAYNDSKMDTHFTSQIGDTMKPRQLTPLQEKHWSEEFKKLYRSGVIDADGDLSAEAERAMRSSLVEKNMGTLLAFADQRLADQPALLGDVEEQLPF